MKLRHHDHVTEMLQFSYEISSCALFLCVELRVCKIQRVAKFDEYVTHQDAFSNRNPADNDFHIWHHARGG